MSGASIGRRALLAAFAGGAAMPSPAQGAWPNRSIRMVVPFPPGSAGDTVPRAIASRLQTALGQPVVIDNKPGAAGAIGGDLVAKAPADGYTLLSHTSTLPILPHLQKLPFDPMKDLLPVTQTVSGSYVLVVQPSFPANNLREFIDVVRSRPARLNYGSYGNGSGPHLAMELLKVRTGLFIVHVPFRGAAPALQELLAGRLDMAFDTSVAVVPHIRSGRLKAIAVGGPRPLAALPGIPPVASAVPDFDTDGWQGLFAPAGTPQDIVARLNAEAVKALRAPEFEKAMADTGFTVVGNSPEQFAAVMREQHEKWGRLVRERRI